ncbi:MAG TPA: TolC family protein, partial [Verrucomicrobiae bacterium]|nr:TolC family protein [Verrucomicrobiae bacterium]
MSAALAASAQTETNNAAPRAMSLEDCFQEALAHNFDVQVERYSPQISLYGLNAAYAGWDPSLNLSGQHLYNVSGGGLAPNLTNSIPTSTSDENSYRAGVGGILPFGLQYDFSGNIANTYGSAGGGAFQHTGGSIGVTLVQPLLKNFWIDSTRLNILVAKNRLKYSEQALRQQFITTVTTVANAYFELIY